MGDINKNVNITFSAKDKASAGLKSISKEMDRVTSSVDSFSKKSANLSSYANSLSSSFNNMAGSTKNLGNHMGSVIPSLAKLAAGYLSVTAAIRGAYVLVTDGIKQYKESIEVEAQLTRVIGYKSAALEQYAKVMQKKSIYDDDAIKSAMAQAGAFLKDEAAIKKVTEAAMDLASGRGIDLATATDLITKSVASGTNALSRYGIEMDKSSDKMKRLASLEAGIKRAYGGAAQTEAGTESGKQKQLINDINNLKEDIGKAALPLQTGLLKAEKALLQGGNSAKIWFDEQITNQTQFITDLNKAMADAQAVGGDPGKRTLKALLPGIEEEIKAVEVEIGELRKKYAEAEYKNREKEMVSLDARMQKEKRYLNELVTIRSNISKINVSPTKAGDIEEDPEAKKKREEEFAKSSLEAKKSLNEELYKMDQEALSKTFDGKLQALDYSLAAEKKKYQDQLSLGLIDLEEYYQMAIAIDDKYYNLKNELINEERANKTKALTEIYNAETESKERAITFEIDIIKQNESNKLSMISSFEDRQKQILESTLIGRLKLTESAYFDELTLYKFMLDQKMILQEEYDAMAHDMRIEYNETQAELIIEEVTKWSDTVTNAASTIYSYIDSIRNLSNQDELSKLDEQTKANKESAQKYIKNKKQLQKELDKIDKEAEAKKKDIAKNDQKMALIGSIINTAQAVSGALTMKPPPLGIAMSIIVGALGGLQSGIIASQAFAQGGIIQPVQGVPTSGDKTQVSANPGEMIINQRQQKNLLAMANGYGGGGGIQINETIVVQGNMDSNAIAELKQHREEWLEMLRDSNKQLKYRGYTYAT